MQTVSSRFNQLADGDIRPLSWSAMISFKKEFDDGVTFFTLDQSTLNGTDLLGPSDDNPIQAWDFYNYTDFTERLIYMSIQRTLEFPYSVVSAIADFQLNNYDKYFTPNSSSPISSYILPKRPVRLLQGFASTVLPQFVGLTEGMPEISRTDGTATFTAMDFLTWIYDMPIRDTIAMADGQAVDATNLILNPSFETSLSGWTGDCLLSTSGGFSGNNYLNITIPSGTANASNNSLTGGNLTAGKVYTLSFYVKAYNSPSKGVTFNNGSDIIFLSSGDIPNDNQWRRHSVTFTATAAPLSVSAGVLGVSSDSALAIDAIMLTEGRRLYDYFDGNNESHNNIKFSWNGTPNLSTSNMVGKRLTTDVVLTQIFSDFGLAPSQYDLAKGRNIIPFLFFERDQQTAGDIIRPLMQAEMGMLWLDEQGIIKFRPRLEQPSEAVYIFDADNIVELDLSEDDQIINHVVINANVREVQEYQPVYSKTTSDTTLHVVPAGGTYVFSADLSDPCLTIETPTAGENSSVSWFTAALPDGTEVTSGVSVDSVELKTNTFDITFSNSNLFDVDINQLYLWGQPAKQISVEPTVYDAYDDDSVAKYGEKVLSIDNNFVQSTSQANSLALTLLDEYSEHNDIITLEVKGNPALQLSDIVEIDYEEFSGDYRVIGINNKIQDSKFTQVLTCRRYTPRHWFTLGQSTLNGTDVLAP